MSAIYRSPAGESELKRRYQELLGGWPVPSERLRLPTREGETFVLASGPPDAPPLVLLHGSGANNTMWMSDIGPWSEHFRTYAVDLIGEAGLSAPSRPALASGAYAHWLDDVFDGLGIDGASVVGASLGGWMALDFATRRPERVTRLALLCPGGVGRQKYGWLPATLLLNLLGPWGIRRSARSVAGLSAPEAEPFLDHLVLTFTHFRPRTERLPVFPDDALRRLTMPVLVIAGDRDAMLDSAETARRVRGSVPHATVDLLPGVGHSVIGATGSVLAFLRG
ncbi:alpha/beta fold hydrolase [Allonocardiopsis opalescens]|uniref:Pimeloyl-ACP methyl ester carboxylesterase n=1 Tax=Allonocardiopsis opalescens TaxID=1144618 RepID=A0A2T0Q1P5_9ACTN|nr:alpha/beta fold hydrolase [Allonocardiopsis opalescens]PRX97699.1 pimeloyl-ACP methyl ester carboxylesterase [Allonocardiopsis opalescens]